LRFSLAAFSSNARNGFTVSIGIGNTTIVFCSAPISVSACRCRSYMTFSKRPSVKTSARSYSRMILMLAISITRAAIKATGAK
jgi:hypothetical protein